MLAERPAHVSEANVVDFDIYHPPGVAEDYYASWKALQRPGGPEMVWTPRNGGHWIVVRGKPMAQIWADYENFSSHIQLVPVSEGLEHKLLPTYLDSPEYDPYRSALNQALAPRRVMSWEKSIRALSVSLIEAVEKDGGCNFTTAYAEQFPIMVFMNMCNLPNEDAAELKLWADRMLRPDASATREEVRQYFQNYLFPVIAERRANPGDDLLSTMANAQIGDRMITADEALQMSMSVLFAGLDTVVNFLGFMMLSLAADPSLLAQLRDNRKLIPAAVEEFFRRFPIVTMGRMVTRDQEFAGVQLRAGEVVIMPSALHGIDDEENDRPLEIDFARRNAKHSTFGHGTHRCVGLLLAKAEVRITLEEWLARIPDFSLAPDAKIHCHSGMVGCVEQVPLVWN